jgi:hypothetical protein
VRSPLSSRDEELDQIVSDAEAFAKRGKVLTSVVHEAGLREILKEIDDETTRLREWIGAKL